MGVVMVVAERTARQMRTERDLNLRDALLIGLTQGFALVPGVSRSGATISIGLLLGLRPGGRHPLRFLLAIPAVVGAGLFEIKDIPGGDNTYGWDPRRDGGVLRGGVRRDRVAAALRRAPLYPGS